MKSKQFLRQQTSPSAPADPLRRGSLVAVAMIAAALVLGGRLGISQAFSLAELTQKDASAGVKAALERGADIAVQLLGKQNGFWGNERVRIPLPD